MNLGGDTTQPMARVLQIASVNCGQVTLLNKPSDTRIVKVVLLHVNNIHMTNVKISKLFIFGKGKL